MQSIKKQKLFSWIYNENSNYKNQQLFVDSYIIINTLKGLSNMAKASLREDEYGIVQQTLPNIITIFIQLTQVVFLYVRNF
jgi:nucleoporin NDC1